MWRSVETSEMETENLGTTAMIPITIPAFESLKRGYSGVVLVIVARKI